MKIGVIIPALNEEEAIGKVLDAIPSELNTVVIVVDNGSTDDTAIVAQAHGATVVHESERGYGAACLRGIQELNVQESPDTVVFLDGDYSDYPDEMTALIDPLSQGEADLVIGSRVTGDRDSGALTPQQVFGNWLATRLLRLFYGVRATDLGPFRAITWHALCALDMQDRDFGWTVEMQIRAARKGMRVVEIPVRYRKRIGKSKISGTASGCYHAATKIFKLILALYFVKVEPYQRKGT